MKTKLSAFLVVLSTVAGLALELTAKGTKYYKDKELN
jgi:hypothetical protein